MLRNTLALVLSVAALLSPALSHATVVEGSTFEQLAASTPVIVRATVVAQQARWDDARRRINTYTELQVTEALKGDVPGVILVRQPGGEVGGIGAHVAGAAKFNVGDDVVLFLDVPGDDPSLFVVRTLTAGKVLLEKTALGEVRARRDLRGISFFVPGGAKEPVVRDLNNVEDLGTADAFLQRIRKAIARAAAKGGAR